jgi:cytochrome c553
MLFIALSLAASGLCAQEAPPGATTCSGCHGAGSDLPLDSLSAQDIVTAMTAFRDGSRAATLMPRLVAGFTEEEIAAIAAWIASEEDAE